jgi:hypothetical protein
LLDRSLRFRVVVVTGGYDSTIYRGALRLRLTYLRARPFCLRPASLSRRQSQVPVQSARRDAGPDIVRPSGHPTEEGHHCEYRQCAAHHHHRHDESFGGVFDACRADGRDRARAACEGDRDRIFCAAGECRVYHDGHHRKRRVAGQSIRDGESARHRKRRRRADPDTYANADADCDADGHTNSHTDGNGNADADLRRDTLANRRADRIAHADADHDADRHSFADADRYSESDAYADPDRNSDSECYVDCDADIVANPDFLAESDSNGDADSYADT